MGKFSLKLLPDEPGYPEENPASVAYVNRKLRWTQSECNESMDTIEKALDSKADLGADGKVLESQLPFIGNNVQAYDSKESFPEEGTTNVIYIDNATDKLYKWNDTEYIEVSAGTPVTLDTDNNKITVGVTSIEVAPKSHVDDTTTNPHKVTAAQVDAYTKSEVDSKLKDKLDSTAISDWAKGTKKPEYTASEVGVTLDEKTNKITIDKKSITPLTAESDPEFTKWKDGTSVELGASSAASGESSTALGANSVASGMESVALGANSAASGMESVALGANSAASGISSTALGNSASASDSSVALGYSSAASGISSTALGNSASASDSSVALGANSVASGMESVALGASSAASGMESVALGYSASASYSKSVAIGNNATLNGAYATAIGQGAYANGTSATAIGQGAYAKDNCFGVTYTPDNFFFNSKASESGAVAKSLQEYLNEKADASAIPKLDGYAKTDDVRDKLDLSVYSKYTEWYITDDDYRNVLAKMDGDGQTFTCEAEVYSGQEHPNKITVNVSYDTTTGKVNGVSGGAQTWYPLSVGDQPPAYTWSEFIPDSDAVNMINDPNNGCFTAISYYFDENGQRQSGVVRFKVEYTGAPQELDDTLVKTSDLSQYRKLTDNKVYNEDGTDSGNTYVDSKTFNDLVAKVDTANATLEEVV